MGEIEGVVLTDKAIVECFSLTKQELSDILEEADGFPRTRKGIRIKRLYNVTMGRKIAKLTRQQVIDFIKKYGVVEFHYNSPSETDVIDATDFVRITMSMNWWKQLEGEGK